jgi:glycosyltransferase involved in cell wall biosynthesis
LRTRLLAEELARRGHEVVWWASCFNHLRKEWQFREDTTFKPIAGVTVHALKSLGYRRNVSARRWLDHRMFARKFRVRARQAPRPDLVVTSLPPHDLAAEAVEAARAHGARSVVDIRDKWPDNLVDVMPPPLQAAGRLVLASEFRLRDFALRNADAVLSMTEPLLGWGLNAAGRSRGQYDQVFYLGASRRASVELPHSIRRLIEERLAGRFVVAFVGTFSTYHNPEAMIDAARILRHRPEAVFVLVGTGDLEQHLRRKAAVLENVVFTGWLDSAEMSWVLQHSHLGLCTSGKLSEREFLPNKVFSYLAEGLPIGSVFDGELRALIDGHGMGFNFSTSSELAGQIEELIDSPHRRSAMAAAAKQFFDSRCDAAAIYRRYADSLEALAGANPAGRPGRAHGGRAA